jgi:hypothetical protein
VEVASADACVKRFRALNRWAPACQARRLSLEAREGVGAWPRAAACPAGSTGKSPEREQGRGAWLARLRGALECSRPRGEGPREGADLGMRLGGPGRRGQRGAGAAWAGSRRHALAPIVSLCPCSSAISSRFWNRSAPKCE